MQVCLFKGTLLFLVLLPVAILSYGSTIDSIVDSTMKDVPAYLIKNAEKFHISSVDGFIRSCPVSFYETLLGGEITYTLGTCFNITGMIIAPPVFLFNKVEIGKAKVDIFMQVKKGVRPKVKFEMSMPVLQDSYVYAWMKIPISDFWKNIIVRGAKKVVESKLQHFITAHS